jgi:ribosomal protein L11 methyltransferase
VILNVVVSVAAPQAELAADRLWSLGVVAVEQIDGPMVELRTSLGNDRDDVERALSLAFADGLATWRLVEVDESVADSWRAFATPTWVEPDLVIVPAWIDHEPFAPDVTVVLVEPGATFGAGDHPTTVLSLRAVRRALRAGRNGASVLDVGCGSGVLAVGAVLSGARSAQGIDIAPAAVPVTTANAAGNGVSSSVSVATTPLADVMGEFDIVVANILAPALIELSADLVRVVADGGVLIISGVLVERFDHVVSALAPLRVQQVDQSAGWAAVTLSR